MRIQGLLAGMVCAAGILIVAGRAAIASEVLYDNSGFIQGQQSFEQSFNLAGPGTLTVTLTNSDWPQPLANLNMIVSTSQGLLGPEMGAGTETFRFGGGQVFAQWFGTAQGSLDTGVYGMKVEWTPTVPLPTSIVLFLSGLALLAWQRREREARRNARQLPQSA